MDKQLQEIFAGSGWTESQRAFYQEFWEGTQASKNNPEKRLWKKKVFIHLKYDSPNHITLEGINAVKEMKGHGGKALQWLIKIADKHGISICLNVYPYSTKLSNPLYDPNNLEAWYKRRRFEDNIFQMAGERPLIYRP